MNKILRKFYEDVDVLYPATSVANYLIWYALSIGLNPKPFHIQSSLYFLQAYWMIEKERPLFGDPIKKWKIGPIVESVYQSMKHQYCTTLWHPIYTTPKLLKIHSLEPFENEYFEYDPEKDEFLIRDQDRIILEKFIELICQYTVDDLLKLLLNQDIYSKDKELINSNEKPLYNLKEMNKYFDENPKEQIWSVYPDFLNI